MLEDKLFTVLPVANLYFNSGVNKNNCINTDHIFHVSKKGIIRLNSTFIIVCGYYL